VAGDRVKFGMSVKQAVEAICCSDETAKEICHNLALSIKKIDPDAIKSGIMHLNMLDLLGVYEKDIVKLWSVCNQKMINLIALLRAKQLGWLANIDEKTIWDLINHKTQIDFSIVIAAVQNRLPNFFKK